MKKAEFTKKVDIAVEIEYEFGGRNWKVMKESEVQAYIDNLDEDEYLSDIDYSSKQEFPEVREILDKAEDIWFNHKEVWQEQGFTNLGQVIDSLLEDDEPKPETEVKVWSEDEIRRLIQENDTVLYRALKSLYNMQTESEKCTGTTRVYNGVGFNSYDSKFLTSTAEFLFRTGFLTDKQKAVVRKKMVKYTKQLTKIANRKEQEKSA